jgi:hypothetical protein
MVSRRPDRRGRTSLGCLLSLALFVAALYYGIHIGEVYLRYYRMMDVMRFQASLGSSVRDDAIGRRLAAAADTILRQSPVFRIRRGGRPLRITIQTEYKERVDLPFFHYTFVLRPRAEAPL